MSEAFRSPESPNLVRTLIPAAELPIYKEAADETGVGLHVVAEAGDTYTHFNYPEGEEEREEGEMPDPPTVTGTVPEDQVYIELSSSRADIADFWAAVDANRQS